MTNPRLTVVNESDLTAAYNGAAGCTPVNKIPVQLGGTTLILGV